MQWNYYLCLHKVSTFPFETKTIFLVELVNFMENDSHGEMKL